MTISSREKPVPTGLPSARLYLEDIAEIVRILVEATRDREQNLGSPVDSRTTFRVGDRISDDIQDLPRMAKSPKEFELWVSKDKINYQASFGVSQHHTQWTTGFTPNKS
jgi:hypothetical protein